MTWGELKVGDVVSPTAYGAPMLVLESRPDVKPLMYLRLFNLETGQFESHGVNAKVITGWFMFPRAKAGT